MSGNLKQIGAAVAAMFADKDEAEIARLARADRLPRIIAAKAVITPQMLELVAADEMPENFEITREAYVAIAQLAMRACQLVQAVAEIDTPPARSQH